VVGLVLNAGYNGSRATTGYAQRTACDAEQSLVPTRQLRRPGCPVQFTHDQAEAFSKLSAGTCAGEQRLSNGLR